MEPSHPSTLECNGASKCLTMRSRLSKDQFDNVTLRHCDLRKGFNLHLF